MKFRTEIEPFTLGTDIDYRSRLLALGSCFAEHIAARLSRARFRIEANPTGILFNPASIVRTLDRLWHAEPVRREELHRSREGVWFHYDFHGSLSRTEADEALDAMNEAVRRGAEALHGADTLLLTFGTAWVYDHEGRPVANCHRQPAAEFHRRRMTVEEIVAPFARLLEGELAAKRLIVSVSPVRHAGDGLVENSLSKATLRLAAAALEERFAERVRYFPAYEMLVDDLRDYRFYAEDLVHPRRRPSNMSGSTSRRQPSRSGPGGCCPRSSGLSAPRSTACSTPAARRAAPSAGSSSPPSRRSPRSISPPNGYISHAF